MVLEGSRDGPYFCTFQKGYRECPDRFSKGPSLLCRNKNHLARCRQEVTETPEKRAVVSEYTPEQRRDVRKWQFFELKAARVRGAANAADRLAPDFAGQTDVLARIASGARVSFLLCGYEWGTTPEPLNP